MTKKYPPLNIDEKLYGFLVGSKLGDGGFTQRTKKHNAYIVFKHCDAQHQYLLWKHKLLNNYDLITNQKIKRRKTENENWSESWDGQHYFVTNSRKELNQFNSMTISELLENLNEIGLAVWFLDDGNFHKKTCKVSCGRFSKAEKELAVKIIKERFYLNFHVYEHPSKPKGYIRATVPEFHKIKRIIKNNVNCSEIINQKLYKD